MEGIVSINGKIAGSPDEARISVLDRGFLFGDQVFEVLVAFGSKILDQKEHLSRLRKSARALDLSIPWGDGELTLELEALVQRLRARKTYLRLTVTRGEGLTLKPGDLQPNKIIYALPARVEHKSVYEKGLSL